MARWNEEMLDRLADQTQANTEAITRLEAQVSELREGQAMMMQFFREQQAQIFVLQQETREIRSEVRLLLDVLTRNYPNGHQGTN